jgi:hypothetical protein
MNAVDAKSIILKTAQELGFHRAVIASLAPMEAEREHFEQWLSKGFAAGISTLVATESIGDYRFCQLLHAAAGGA